MKITDFNTEGRYSYLIAEEDITRKDALFISGLTGKAAKIENTKFASIGTMTYGSPQTSEATGRIIAQTQVVSTAPGNGYIRKACLVDSNKDIYTFDIYNANNHGATLSKFDNIGSLLGTINVDTSPTATYSHVIKLLSNGNILVAYVFGVNVLKFAIYTPSLSVVTALTTIATISSTYGFSITALTTGGFSVVYHNALNTLLITYNNSGTITTAATNIWTRIGTNGNQFISTVELSNGNIAIAESSVNTVDSIGLYYGIYTTAAVQVVAFTLIDATSGPSFPEIESSGTGYFCIARSDGTKIRASVFNNAGTVQGADYTLASTAGTNNFGGANKLVYGNNNFWLMAHRSSDSKCILIKIPLTGTNYIVTNITLATITQFNCHVIDAFYSNEHIIAVASTTANSLNSLFVISTETGLLVSTSNTAIGTVSVGGGYHRLIDGGDGSFVLFYGIGNTAGIYLCAGKFMATAIIGTAASNASAGTSVAINSQAGAYQINAIVGYPSVAFDHTVNPLVGNKGTILKNSITVRGL